jgi:CRP-like cAMP-binding protein
VRHSRKHDGKILSTRSHAEVSLPPSNNLLLAALPDVDYVRLEPHLDPVRLSCGMILAEPGAPVTHVYFPTEGIVSILVELEHETPMEIAIIGNEGMVGTALLLGGLEAQHPLHRSVVQVPGQAYRMRADILFAEFKRGDKLRHWLLCFTQALIAQVAQIAGCSRHHEVEAQVCRWLLQRLDRLASGQLYVTHKEIAALLGVRREGVTQAACDLQEAGLIRYARGHVQVIDRAGLERRACECVKAIKEEYSRILGA